MKEQTYHDPGIADACSADRDEMGVIIELVYVKLYTLIYFTSTFPEFTVSPQITKATKSNEIVFKKM